jgi:hypothetical protein
VTTLLGRIRRSAERCDGFSRVGSSAQFAKENAGPVVKWPARNRFHHPWFQRTRISYALITPQKPPLFLTEIGSLVRSGRFCNMEVILKKQNVDKHRDRIFGHRPAGWLLTKSCLGFHDWSRSSRSSSRMATASGNLGVILHENGTGVLCDWKICASVRGVRTEKNSHHR